MFAARPVMPVMSGNKPEAGFNPGGAVFLLAQQNELVILNPLDGSTVFGYPVPRAAQPEKPACLQKQYGPALRVRFAPDRLRVPLGLCEPGPKERLTRLEMSGAARRRPTLFVDSHQLRSHGCQKCVWQAVTTSLRTGFRRPPDEVV